MISVQVFTRRCFFSRIRDTLKPSRGYGNLPARLERWLSVLQLQRKPDRGTTTAKLSRAFALHIVAVLFRPAGIAGGETSDNLGNHSCFIGRYG